MLFKNIVIYKILNYENISLTFSKKDLSELLGAGLKLSSSVIF